MAERCKAIYAFVSCNTTEDEENGSTLQAYRILKAMLLEKNPVYHPFSRRGHAR
jgi:hypothetical protein